MLTSVFAGIAIYLVLGIVFYIIATEKFWVWPQDVSSRILTVLLWPVMIGFVVYWEHYATGDRKQAHEDDKAFWKVIKQEEEEETENDRY
jgi:hypothetical protein